MDQCGIVPRHCHGQGCIAVDILDAQEVGTGWSAAAAVLQQGMCNFVGLKKGGNVQGRALIIVLGFQERFQ